MEESNAAMQEGIDQQMDEEQDVEEDAEERKIEVGEGSESGGSDESDSDDEDEEAKVERLRQELSDPARAWSYDTHAELVRTLRVAGDFGALREARKEMSKRFPLSPQLWLEWAEDELRVGDRASALKVLQEGEQEYLSMDIIMRELQLAAEAYKSKQMSKAEVIERFESAVTMAGAEFHRGIEIWRAYRQFIRDCGEDEGKVLARELRIPLNGLQSDLDYAQQHFPQMCVAEEKNIETALSRYTSLRTVEETVQSQSQAMPGPGVPTAEVWNAWKALIQAEEKIRDPSRVRLAHERAASCCFLLAEAWSSYTHFILTVLKDKYLRVSVLRRAVRNCPWSEELWCELLRALENVGCNEHEVLRAFEAACVQGRVHKFSCVDLSCSLLQYLRRCLQADQAETILEMTQKTQEEGSVGWCTVTLAGAKVAMKMERTELGKHSLESILRYRGKESFWWLEFVTILECYNMIDDARKLFKRGTINVSTKEELDALSGAWLELESLKGSLQQYEDAKIRISAQSQLIQRKRGYEYMEDPDGKRMKIASENDETKMAIETPSGKKKGHSRQHQKGAHMGDPNNGNEEANTVYVSNLPFSLTKEGLAQIFREIPGFKEARLITRQSDGASRGYGYVEFFTAEGVEDAIKLHRTSFQGRQIHVKRSNPKLGAELAQRRQLPAFGIKPEKSSKSDRGGVKTRDQHDHKGGPNKRIPREHRPRGRLSFGGLLPLAVQRKTQENSAKKDSSTEDKMEAQKSDGNLSQNDFRNMLLKR